jgi:tape measure domain-containing protein
VANYVIRLIVDNRGALGNTAQVTRAIRDAEKAAKDAQRQVSTLSNQVSGLVTLLAARQFVQLADTYTSIANKLKTVSNGHDDLRQNMERTFKIAQDNRVSWESLAKTYSRIQRSTRELRLSQNEVADMTDTLTKAIGLSGATTAETNAVLIQFGQALSKGKLDGDEFKSVMENSVEVGNILTKSLGVTRGELMKMSKAGQITNQVIVKAFREARAEIVERFGDAVPTIASRFTQLRNAIVKALGESVAPMTALGNVIGFLTRNADLMIKGFMVLGTVVLGVQLVRGLNAAVIGVRALTLAMATNPVLAMTAAILGLIAALSALENRPKGVTQERLGTGDKIDKNWTSAMASNSYGDRQAYIQSRIQQDINVTKDLEKNLATLKKAIDEALDVTPMERFIAKMRDLTLVSDGIRAHWQTMWDVSTIMTKGVTEAVIKNVERAVKKAEEARREAEAFKSKFESFNSALNPAAAAAYELANGLDTLNEALRRKMITIAEAADLYERLRESIAGVNQVASGANASQLVTIQNPDGGTSQVQMAPSFLPSTSLPKAGIDRTDLLLSQDADRTKSRGSDLFKDSLPQQKQILEELRGPEEERRNRLVAMNVLLADQAINQDQYNKLLKELTDEQMLAGVKKLDEALVMVFDNATDALADFLYTGEFGFRKMVDAMLRDISRLLAQQLIMGALGATTGASSGNWIAAGGAMLGKAEHGANFTVGGTGGTDSQLVAFHATPGESVLVQTPQQKKAGAGMGGGTTVVNNQIAFDPRMMADMLNTPGGQRAIANAVRINPSIINQRLK